MIEIIKSTTNFDFVSKFKITSIISFALVFLSLYGIFFHMKYGVDFRGGAEIQVKFSDPPTLEKIRSTLKANGFSGFIVQTIGDSGDNEFLIKLKSSENDVNETATKASATLNKNMASFSPSIRKVDIVGPKAGAELRNSGFLAMFWALIAIMIYVGMRFEFKYSPGAIAALFHDVCIILGIFSFLQIEFTLQVVAAILAVIGYSVNDTVIVYDRVREHEDKFPEATLSEHINGAINETLSRTILTSSTTLFISITMYIFGGAAISNFFLAISAGVLIGTYSSIFVAAPVTMFFDRFSDSKKN